MVSPQSLLPPGNAWRFCVREKRTEGFLSQFSPEVKQGQLKDQSGGVKPGVQDTPLTEPFPSLSHTSCLWTTARASLVHPPPPARPTLCCWLWDNHCHPSSPTPTRFQKRESKGHSQKHALGSFFQLVESGHGDRPEMGSKGWTNAMLWDEVWRGVGAADDGLS